MIDFNDPTRRVQLRIMRILASALVLSVVLFLAVVLVIVSNRPQEEHEGHGEQIPQLTWTAAGMLALSVVLSFVLPRITMRSGLSAKGSREGKPGKEKGLADPSLASVQAAMITTLAPLEGTGLLGGIAYLQEGRPLALVVTGAALLLMLAYFPTEARVRAWLDQQRELHDQLRRSS